MDYISAIGTILEDTILHKPGIIVYERCRVLREHLKDRMAGGNFGVNGWYQVETRGEKFWIYLTGSGQLFRDRINGVYEPEVHDAISQELTDTSSFWEVGAAWGYFSLWSASVCEKVTSFEIQKQRADYMKKSLKKNEFSNVTVVEGTVGDSVDLSDYEPPNIALIDIEGWEYEMLSNTPTILENNTTFVIEVHENSSYTVGDPEINPEGVIKLLRENGYKINQIANRGDENYHIIAKK